MRKVSAIPKARAATIPPVSLAGAPAAPAVDDHREKRRHAIRAAVVRVMKSRREVGHADLYDTVKAQLSRHFLLTPHRFKDVVADLINQEYMDRHPKSRDVYVYLA
jgi:hypothetical protein